MTTEKFAPFAGQSIETDAKDWPGGPAIVKVACTALPWGGAQLLLDSQEVRIDGRGTGSWSTLARFHEDDLREMSLPPGRYRFQIVQQMHDAHRRAWTVDVSPRPRPQKS